MIPKNPGIAQKGTHKSGSNPEKYPNNGTSLYQDIYELTARVLEHKLIFQEDIQCDSIFVIQGIPFGGQTIFAHIICGELT